MANTKSFYLPDDVLDAIAEAGNGSAYITDLVRRDIHRRQLRAMQARAGHSEEERVEARRWAAEQIAAMRERPADYAELRKALGIPDAAA
jgi:hypothetical protein